MLRGMSGRRFLGIACVSWALLAIYACGGDDDVVNAPDERTDASQPDSALPARDGSTTDRYVPSEPLPPSSLALGEGFACIIAADHSVYCWGRNDVGQLGSDPAKTPSCGAFPCTATPVKVEGMKSAVAITAGKDFACAIDDEKHGWCWGNNSKNQLAARSKVGFRFTPELVTDGTAQIVAAGQHACILDTDGFLHCWGDNDCGVFDGQTDAGTVGILGLVMPQAKSVSLGPDSMCTVSAETSEVYCWGADHNGSLGHPLPGNAGKCAGGTSFDPSPKRWVSDKLGHILTGAEDVHVGSTVTCVRKTDGTVLCAGDNTHGGLGLGTPDVDRHEVPVEVPALKATKVVVAGETACAIVTDKLLCWGDARFGQMPTGGLGTDCSGVGCRPLGVVLESQAALRSLAMSPSGIGTIKNDVSVWIWGRNDSGEVGLARTDPANASCIDGIACVGAPRQMTNLPALD